MGAPLSHVTMGIVLKAGRPCQELQPHSAIQRKRVHPSACEAVPLPGSPYGVQLQCCYPQAPFHEPTQPSPTLALQTRQVHAQQGGQDGCHCGNCDRRCSHARVAKGPQALCSACDRECSCTHSLQWWRDHHFRSARPTAPYWQRLCPPPWTSLWP